MIKMLSQAAMLAAFGLALGSCTPQTTAPVKKAPAADYQAEVPPPPAAASIKAICYNDADLATFRARMVQGEFAVATLQCQNASGARALEDSYRAFLTKFNAELVNNTRELNALAGRKRLNTDIVVTQFANRTAQRPSVDGRFCERAQRAFEWALTTQVTSLSQVPAMYDLGPDMNVYPCPKP